MAEVACFCGCLYSFDGGAGACPKCGEYATVTAGRRAGTGGRDMIVQDRYDDLELAEIGVAEFVLGRAGDRGGKLALIDGSDGRVVSYGELAVSVRRPRRAWQRAGWPGVMCTGFPLELLLRSSDHGPCSFLVAQPN